MKFVTQESYKHKKQYEEKASIESDTVQGEGLSVSEIFHRATSGLTNVGTQVGYDEDPDHDSIDEGEFQRLDLVEQEELTEQSYNTEVSAAKKKLAAEKAAKEKAAEKREKEPAPTPPKLDEP